MISSRTSSAHHHQHRHDHHPHDQRLDSKNENQVCRLFYMPILTLTQGVPTICDLLVTSSAGKQRRH